MNFKKGEVLFFNKPLGWTSFKVVGHARYHICRRIGVKKLKVGHAGTLDPLATGVMIVCTGKATKRIEEFQYHTKEYVATLRLGATTPSYDLEHEIDATYPTGHITRERVVCSKGTYIRALARDIGEALHSGAHLTGLIRTRVGDVRLEDCLDPALFKEWIDGQEIENDEENN